MRTRIERLLALRKETAATEAERIARGVRILEYVGTLESQKRLEELAAGAEGARLTEAAKTALKRMQTAPKR